VGGLDREFLEGLRATFRVEAAEHLQAIAAGVVELEKAAPGEEQKRLIETVFRAAHSLKGAARAVNLSEIESQCELLEALFSAWKRGEDQPTHETLDGAHRTLDEIGELLVLPAPYAQQQQGEAAHARVAMAVAERDERDKDAADKPAVAERRSSLSAETETVRVAVSLLDARLVEAEEMLAVKLAAEQRMTEVAALARRFGEWRKEWANIEPRVRAIGCKPVAPESRSVGEFFEWNREYLRGLESSMLALAHSSEQDSLLVRKLTDELLENSKKLLMLPVATLTPLLSKVVRDLCRDQGKEAEFVIRGEETTVDKRILEELKDPLVHLLRNAVDHGIEQPEERRRAGKSARAAITLAVSAVDGNQVEIAVSDDGAGVDVEGVKSAAAERGVASRDQLNQMPQAALLDLVFETDVSTSPMITQLSGRGLGLAIVREKTERLGGHAVVDTRRGAGTTVHMTLPVTLATFRGILTQCAQRRFILPSAQVERVTRFKPQDVQTVEGRCTLALNGRAVALVDLAEALQLPPAPATRGTGKEPANGTGTPAVVVGKGAERVAFAVDQVLDEREVLVKQFRKPLSRVRNISGATVLGSGEVVPIVNTWDLLKTARHATGRRSEAAASLRPETSTSSAPAKRILVVEDSITSRMLLKGILETAGYEVKTAVDGIEALTALRTEAFDLLVSDVEMPRMNGFDLTARLRADKALGELPVVLVTALESREDRERGVEVGANAYLVKRSLEQGNLLEALRRLL
jgi:two-component system, chemotaxis family, sensor kinase CheA